MIKNISAVVKVLFASKDEIKQLNCKREDDALKQLVYASVQITLKFFETLKKQLKRSED